MPNAYKRIATASTELANSCAFGVQHQPNHSEIEAYIEAFGQWEIIAEVNCGNWRMETIATINCAEDTASFIVQAVTDVQNRSATR